MLSLSLISHTAQHYQWHYQTSRSDTMSVQMRIVRYRSNIHIWSLKDLEVNLEIGSRGFWELCFLFLKMMLSVSWRLQTQTTLFPSGMSPYSGVGDLETDTTVIMYLQRHLTRMFSWQRSAPGSRPNHMRSDKAPWIRRRQISNGYIDHSCVRQRRRTSCSGCKGELRFSILCNICMMICTTHGRRFIS